jgi:hypothetical protein
VKNPKITFVQCNFHGKHSETLTLFLVMHAPAAVASPSWDIDVLPVREITQFQTNSGSLYPNTPRPPMGTGGAGVGIHTKNEVFSRTIFFVILKKKTRVFSVIVLAIVPGIIFRIG